MKRTVVVVLAKLDGALDGVFYRPAVVQAFAWIPRWWQCELAKLSCRLDDRWQVGYWRDDGRPGVPCEVCGRRASWLEIGGRDPEVDDPEEHWFLDDRTIPLCSWCQIRGPITDEDDLERELADARRASISGRWRWSARDA
jgi:hypothetical protein